MPPICGRYSITTAPEALRRLFRLPGPLANLPPRYNLAPTQDAPVVWQRQDGRELVMLRWGLVPSWSKGPDGEVIQSFTIVVTDANELLRPIHDRMPVIVDPADYALWLGEEAEAGIGIRSLLKPFPVEALVAYPMSRRVSNPRNDDPQCVEPLRAPSVQPVRPI